MNAPTLFKYLTLLILLAGIPATTCRAVQEEEGYGAIAVDWVKVMTIGFPFEKGKYYKLGPLAISASQKGILGTLDTETTLYVVVPPAGEEFPDFPVPSIPGIPIQFSAIGAYEKLVPNGQASVPVFRCVYLKVNGKEVYKAPTQTPETTKKASGNPAKGTNQDSASWTIPLNSTMDEFQRSMGLPAVDQTEEYFAACRNKGVTPEFNGKQAYDVPPSYVVQVFFRGGRSSQVAVTTIRETLDLPEAMGIFRRCAKDAPITKVAWLDNASRSFGWETLDGRISVFKEIRYGKPTLCIILDWPGPEAKSATPPPASGGPVTVAKMGTDPISDAPGAASRHPHPVTVATVGTDPTVAAPLAPYWKRNPLSLSLGAGLGTLGLVALFLKFVGGGASRR